MLEASTPVMSCPSLLLWRRPSDAGCDTKSIGTLMSYTVPMIDIKKHEVGLPCYFASPGCVSGSHVAAQNPYVPKT